MNIEKQDHVAQLPEKGNFIQAFHRIKFKKKKEDDLIQNCLKGNRKAQYELYEKYAKAMYHVCLRIVGQPEETEDVLQEAFIKAFSRLHTYKASASFGAWLKRIMVNTAINHIKKKRAMLVQIEEEHLETKVMVHDANHATHEENEIQFQVESIKKALHQLPDGFRTIFSLYAFEGYDHGEIAQIMDISVSTSKSQYSRAKRKLIQILTK